MLKLAMILNIIFISLVIYTFYPIKYVDPQIKPYKDRIVNIIKDKCGDRYNKRIKEITQFGLLDGYIIGLCEESKLRMNITLDKLYWNFSDENEKLALVAHEEFHCLLNAKHSPDMRNFMHDVLPSITEEELLTQMNNYLINICGDKNANSRK